MAPRPKLPEGATSGNPVRFAPRSNDALAESFGTWLKVLGRSRSVIYSRPHTVRKFAETLSGRSLLGADRSDVRAFAAAHSSVSMRAQAIWSLRVFYDFLRFGDLTRRNPAREVCVPKLPQRIPVVPTVEEVERLLRAVEDAANAETE
jgi:site-specific recombinase XerD